MNCISPLQARARCKHEMLPLSRCSCEQAHDTPLLTPTLKERAAGHCPGPPSRRGSRLRGTSRCARPCPQEQPWGRCPVRPNPGSARTAGGEGRLGARRPSGQSRELRFPPVALRLQPLSPAPSSSWGMAVDSLTLRPGRAEVFQGRILRPVSLIFRLRSLPHGLL